jgi:copper homeostasis protein
MTLEVCVQSLAGARAAQQAGAQRVELCSAISEGGITPSPALITIARHALQIKLHVLIRPRGGDFLYDDDEFEVMLSDVHYCGRAKCDGVVIGMLRADGTIDSARCRQLVLAAKEYGMSVTFHRAFDRSASLPQSLEDVIALGCQRILTSGGCDSVIDGMQMVRQLIVQAAGRIIIMPGAGITAENAAMLLQSTGASEIHGTLSTRRTSTMIYRNPLLSNHEQEYSLPYTDAEKIQLVMSIKS